MSFRAAFRLEKVVREGCKLPVALLYACFPAKMKKRKEGKRGQSPWTEIMKILRGHRASHSLKSNCANCSAITEYGRANSGIRARIQRARTPCAFFSVRSRQKIQAAAWFSYIQPPVDVETSGSPLSYKELPPFFCLPTPQPHSRQSSFCFNTNFQGARARKMGNVSLER